MTFINEKSLLSCFSNTFIIHLEYPKRGSIPQKIPKYPQKYEYIFHFLKTKSIPLCHKCLTFNRCTIKILKYNPKAKCTIMLIFDPGIEYLPFIL